VGATSLKPPQAAPTSLPEKGVNRETISSRNSGREAPGGASQRGK